MASALCIGCLSIPATLEAQLDPQPITGELQVNQATAGDQAVPAVGMAADGTHVVVWASAGQDGDQGAIVRRKFPGDGSQPFNESVINETTAGDQFNPHVSVNANGDFLAAWDSGVAGEGLRARRSTLGGTSLAPEFRLSVSTSSSPQFAFASRADDDSFVGLWSDGDLFFRRFGADGSPQTGDVEIAPALPTLQFHFAADSNADGSFVAAFGAADSDGGGILAQRFNAAGEPVGEPIPVPEQEDNNQVFPSVGVADDGSFVVLWGDVALGLRARRFAPDGTPRGGEIPVFAGTGIIASQLSVTPSGAFEVAFRPSAGEVNAREFDRLGRPVGDAHQVNVTNSGAQAAMDVAAQADRFVVVWHSENLDGDGFAIARRLFRLRSIFADDFETEDTSGWSQTIGD